MAGRTALLIELFGQGALRVGFYQPQGVARRFERYSEDFATWVFFYGPEGGEASRGKAP